MARSRSHKKHRQHRQPAGPPPPPPLPPPALPATPPRYIHLFLALFLLAGLVGTVVLAVAGWTPIARAESYQHAPLCAPDITAACRQELPATVASIEHAPWFQDGPIYLITLRVAAGTVAVHDHTGNLAAMLHAGDGVQAEYWEGQVVALRTIYNYRLITDANPVAHEGDAAPLLPLAALLGVLVGIGGLKWLRSLPAGRPVRTAPVIPAPLPPVPPRPGPALTRDLRRDPLPLDVIAALRTAPAEIETRRLQPGHP